MQSTFAPANDSFKNKLQLLIEGIDEQKKTFPNLLEEERHGFYQLEDDYDDDAFLAVKEEGDKVEEVRKGIEEMNIEDSRKAPKLQKKREKI